MRATLEKVSYQVSRTEADPFLPADTDVEVERVASTSRDAHPGLIDLPVPSLKLWGLDFGAKQIKEPGHLVPSISAHHLSSVHSRETVG